METGAYDAAIVTSSYRVHDADGEWSLSPSYAIWVDEAAGLQMNGTVDRLVFSGCYDRTDWAAPLTMAEQAAQRATGLGVPADKIYVEKMALDTAAHAVFGKQGFVDLLEERSVLIVSSKWQAPRNKVFFERIFGPSYMIKPHGISTPEDKESRWSRKSEAKKIDAFIDGWANVRPGDDEAIRRKMFDRETGYAFYRNDAVEYEKTLGASIAHPEDMRKKFPDLTPYRTGDIPMPQPLAPLRI